jgi:hypothetical protein
MFVVFEFPFKDREFDSLEEAIAYVVVHKGGGRDTCWIENSFGDLVWSGAGQ